MATHGRPACHGSAGMPGFPQNSVCGRAKLQNTDPAMEASFAVDNIE
jgi:hypothetical protein